MKKNRKGTYVKKSQLRGLYLEADVDGVAFEVTNKKGSDGITIKTIRMSVFEISSDDFVGVVEVPMCQVQIPLTSILWIEDGREGIEEED